MLCSISVNFLLKPYLLNTFHRASMSVESNAFLKSKNVKTGVCWPLYLSKIWQKTNIWSLVERPGLKPACDSVKVSSAPLFIWLRITTEYLAKNYRTYSSAIIAICRSLFFKRGMITECCQSSGTLPIIQMKLNSIPKTMNMSLLPFFNTTGGMPSGPCALLFFKDLTAASMSVSNICSSL